MRSEKRMTRPVCSDLELSRVGFFGRIEYTERSESSGLPKPLYLRNTRRSRPNRPRCLVSTDYIHVRRRNLYTRALVYSSRRSISTSAAAASPRFQREAYPRGDRTAARASAEACRKRARRSRSRAVPAAGRAGRSGLGYTCEVVALVYSRSVGYYARASCLSERPAGRASSLFEIDIDAAAAYGSASTSNNERLKTVISAPRAKCAQW